MSVGSVGGIALAKSSTAHTPHDALLMPDGRKLGQVGRGLTALLVKFGVAGASHEGGHAANAEAYAAHLDKIYADAGKAAVSSWLAANKG